MTLSMPKPADAATQQITTVIQLDDFMKHSRGDKSTIPTVEMISNTVLASDEFVGKPMVRIMDQHGNEFKTTPAGDFTMIKAGKHAPTPDPKPARDDDPPAETTFDDATIQELIQKLGDDPMYFVRQRPLFFKVFDRGTALFKGEVQDYDADLEKWVVCYNQAHDACEEPDHEMEGFSAAQMTKYVIKQHCAPAKDRVTHGQHQALIANTDCRHGRRRENICNMPAVRQEIYYPREHSDQWESYVTPRDMTFFDVTAALGIDEERMYYGALGPFYGPQGVGHDEELMGAVFRFPWGGDETLPRWHEEKAPSAQTTIPAGTSFPIPGGVDWDKAVKRNREIRKRHPSDDHLTSEVLKHHMNRIEANEIETQKERSDTRAKIDRDPDWPNWDLKKWMDISGRIKAPKNMAEAQGRPDWPRWKAAFEKEMASLDLRDTLQHHQRLKNIRAQGIHSKPVGMRVILSVKYHPDGSIEKYKARNVIQGHPGAMFKGVHYNETFSASPKPETTRALMAAFVGKKMYRKCSDIETAYLWGRSAEEYLIAVRYPEGLRRREKFEDTGKEEELYAVCSGNCYGKPDADRIYTQLRDSETLRLLNQDGWTCRKSVADPCLFIIRRKIEDSTPRNPDAKKNADNIHDTHPPTFTQSYLCIYTDDCDILGERQEDVDGIDAVLNARFKTKEGDARFMLGILRELNEDGTELTMSQPEFIRTTYEEHCKHMATKSNPNTPTPPKMFLYLDPDGVDENESQKYKDMGYQSLVGSLLWAAYRCFPQCASGVHMFCRMMSSPTKDAWDGALHMLRYMYHRRHTGIRFRRDGNRIPVAYYDASNKPEPIKGKRQFGFVIMWRGGPVLWAAKKHRLASTSAPMAEYMALGECGRAVRWFRRLLTEMGYHDEIAAPTKVLGDNDGATQLSREDLVTPGNRHILDDYHLSKEMIARWEIETHRIDTADNISDLFTKSVTAAEMILEEFLTGHTEKDLPMQAAKFTNIKPGEKSSLAYRICDSTHIETREQGVSGLGQKESAQSGRGPDEDDSDVTNIVRALSDLRGLPKRTVIGKLCIYVNKDNPSRTP